MADPETRQALDAVLAEGARVSWAYANPAQSDEDGTGSVGEITEHSFAVVPDEPDLNFGFKFIDLAYGEERDFGFDTKDGYIDVSFD
jgi:hypothetical protein